MLTIREWKKGDQLIVDGPPEARLRVLRELPTAKTVRTGALVVPKSGWTLAQLQKEHGISCPKELMDLMAPWLWGDNRQTFQVRTRAWQHQRDALQFAHLRAGTLLGIPMGGGKTKVAIDLMNHWGVKRVLIICPLAAVGVWPKQFGLHSLQEIPYANSTKGTSKQRATEAYKFLRANPGALIVNHQSVWRDAFADMIAELDWDVLIVDECHRAKAHQGKLSKYLQSIRGRFAHRLGLSGTPWGQHEPDIFAQARFLDPGYFGDGWTKFAQRYVQFGGPEGQWVQGILDHMQEEFAHLCSQFLYIKTQEEIDAAADLPEILPPSYLECDLPPKVRKEYDRLAKEFVAFLDQGQVTAPNVLSKLTRLAQLCSGHIRTDDGDLIEVSTHKADVLSEHLQDCEFPVVVAARFTPDLRAIRRTADKLGLRYHEVSGSSKELAPDGTIRGDTEVLGVQVQSGSEAVDFTAAHHCIVYSMDYSVVLWKQLQKRLHRPGQRHKVSFAHIVVPDSADTMIRTSLQELLSNQQLLSELVQRNKQV